MKKAGTIRQTAVVGRDSRRDPPAWRSGPDDVGDVDGCFHDIRGAWPELHDPVSYVASQRFAVELRDRGRDGIVYDSVRAPGGACLAVFHPATIGPVRQGPHLQYHWDGARISRVTEARDVAC